MFNTFKLHFQLMFLLLLLWKYLTHIFFSGSFLVSVFSTKKQFYKYESVWEMVAPMESTTFSSFFLFVFLSFFLFFCSLLHSALVFCFFFLSCCVKSCAKFLYGASIIKLHHMQPILTDIR